MNKKQTPIIVKSKELYNRAKPLIPGVTQTLAKGPTQFSQGVSPIYLQAGKGCRVTDVDGNEYIDYCMAIGPIILGYSYPAVDEAVRRQLKDGITFSLMHPLEVELAELLVELIPCAESVRYGKNGCDVTTAAIRLSRAATGREHVITCGYHGWHDWYITVTDRNKGIPSSVNELTTTFQYNDIDSLKEAFNVFKGDVACVIMEPLTIEPPKDGFLEAVRELTLKEGSLLIFDEIWTGFRFAIGGVQEMTGVIPDLATFSKAMANGMPISAIVGKRKYMDLFEKDVFYYLTYGGEALSLAAAVATINEIREKNVIEYLYKQGGKLKEGYNEIAKRIEVYHLTKCVGYPCRSVITFEANAGFDPLEMKTLVQQEMIKRGILWAGFHNISYSHSDTEIEITLSAYEEALSVLRKAAMSGNIKSFLEGSVVSPVFRRLTNFHYHKERFKKIIG